MSIKIIIHEQPPPKPLLHILITSFCSFQYYHMVFEWVRLQRIKFCLNSFKIMRKCKKKSEKKSKNNIDKNKCKKIDFI